MQFDFPEDINPFQIVQSKQKLSQLIKQQLIQSKLLEFAPYKVYLSSFYLYAKCKRCSATLRYKRAENNLFYLFKSQRTHQHRQLKSQKTFLRQIISSMPSDLPCKVIKSILNEKYKISNASFYRHFNFVRNSSLKLQQLVNQFLNYDLMGYYEPLDITLTLPNLLIITSIQSRRAFQRYGDFASFDFTYNLIRQKSSNGLDYRLGILAGLSGSCKLLPYALVFTDNQKKEQIAKIFYQLFKLLGKAPKTIISDEQASIKAGLDLLRYEEIWDGKHILDSFHLLKNLKKSLKNKKNIEIVQKIIKSITINNFLFLKQQIQQVIEDEDDLTKINCFIDDYKESFYCFAQDHLIGFGTSSSPSEKLNDIVKTIIPKSVPLLVAAKKIALHFQKLIKNNQRESQFEKIPIEKFFDMRQLSQIRKSVCKKVFQELCLNISKSNKCKIRTEEDFFCIQDDFGEEKVQVIQSDIFICSCMYQLRSGIPCQHLVKILILLKKSILPYINKRWLIFDQIKQITKEKLRMPRITRKNRIK